MNKNLAALAAVFSICSWTLCSCSDIDKISVSQSDSSEITSGNSSEEEISQDPETMGNVTAYKSEVIKTPDNIYTFGDVSRLNDDEILYQSYDKNDSKIIYYKSDNKFAKFTKIEPTFPKESVEADYSNEIMAFNRDGSFNVFITMEDHEGMVAPNEWDENFDYDTYNENCQSSYMLCRYDKDCNMISAVNLEFPDEYYDQFGYLGINYILADGDSIVASFNNGKVVRINTDDGSISVLYEAVQSSLSYTSAPVILRDRDGNLTFGIYRDEETGRINNIPQMSAMIDYCLFDAEKGTLSEPIYTVDSQKSYRFTAGYGDYLYFQSIDDGFFGIKDDGTAEKLIDWTDSNMNQGLITVISGNEYICNEGERLTRLIPRDPSELANMKELTIANIYGGDTSEIIVNFNSSQDKYHLTSIDYIDPDDEDWEKTMGNAIEKLNMDIVSGNAPDIILGLDYSNYLNLRSKGVFADLDQFMEKDETMGYDDIMPNVISAMKAPDGKVYAMTNSFSFDTIIAKTRLCSKENWTLDEMIEYYDNAPESAVHVYDGDSKMDMLKTMTYTMEDLIDYDEDTCNFDSPDFVKVLEFCNRFVDDIDRPNKTDDSGEDVQQYYSDKFTWLARDLIIAEPITFFSLSQYNLVKHLEGGGEDMTFVGYPSKNGKGGRITPHSIVCISNSCKEKEGAWEFIKNYITNNQYDECVSALVKVFEEAVFQSMTEEGSASGQSIPVYTKEEADMIKEYILGCDQVGTAMDDSIWKVCQEHAQEYFSGGKTAEEAAKMIQNRVSIILSEKS